MDRTFRVPYSKCEDEGDSYKGCERIAGSSQEIVAVEMGMQEIGLL